MNELKVIEAINQALDQAMEENDKIIVLEKMLVSRVVSSAPLLDSKKSTVPIVYTIHQSQKWVLLEQLSDSL